MAMREFRRFLEQETEQTIPQRFSEQVARFPDSPAIRTRSESISYRELDRLSNQVANAVLQRSHSASKTVVLLFEQGVDSIISILGVLKAAQIYVSLDPSTQVEDLRRTIEDCEPGLLLANKTHGKLCNELLSGAADFLSFEATGECSGETCSSGRVSPDTPAYIFYTSGSTGHPKGVLDSHRNVLHNVLRYTNQLEIDHRDRLSMIQAGNFSGTVSSLFSALLNGGAVCPFNLAGEGIDALADFLTETGVTIFHSVPTIFENLVLTGRPFPGFRLVRLEGDRTDPRHIELFDRSFDRQCQLAIGLGATETGLTRQYLHHHGESYPKSGSPLGYAVEGVAIALVDDCGLEVEPGEPGEILVESRYLASGYWQQPERTKECFHIHPDDQGVRRYRTGDMARVQADGCLLYLGRKDFRVKLHGISIETSEIELTLQSHPLIEQALVHIAEPRRGLKQLAAYLVVRKDATLTVCEIRRFASRHLPDYMIPARYNILEALPTDSNGKICRADLPSIGSRRPVLQQSCEPARTAQQMALAACFKDILSLDEVGINDNFYDLGGDSLLAMQLLLLVEERMGLTFPQSKFYESPDIKTIESCLVQKPSRASIVTMQPSGDRSPLFCFQNQLGVVLHYRGLTQLLAPEIPVLGVQAASIPEHVTETSIESMAAEFLPLIQERQGTGPYYLCGNCVAGLLAFEIAQLLVKQGEVVAFLGLIDTSFPMGTLSAAARRIRLSANPMRTAGEIVLNKCLHVSKSLPIRLALLIGVGSESNGDEEALKLQPETDQLFELFNNRTGKLVDSAGARYRPKPYPGQVTLFYSGAMDHRWGWQFIAKGDFFPIQLPTKTDEHMPHLIVQPMVEDLAREIRQIVLSN